MRISMDCAFKKAASWSLGWRKLPVCLSLVIVPISCPAAKDSNSLKGVSPSKTIKPTPVTKPGAKAVATKVDGAKAVTDKTKPFKPSPNRPGIVIGEPVVASEGDGENLTSFGAACSHWLQFYVGGQAELGQTPLWNSLDSAREEMGKPNFQLSSTDVTKVTRALGATHILLGKITPIAPQGSYSLTYQLCDSKRPKNSSPVTLTATGTKTEIWKQLSALGVSLSKTLGVKTPRIPSPTDISEAEMDLLGTGTWVHAGKLTVPQLGLLKDLAAKEPLAALLTLEYADREELEKEWEYSFAHLIQNGATFCDSPLKTQMVDILVQRAGGNVLAWAEMSLIDINQIIPYQKQLGAIANDFPENYALRVMALQYNIYLNWGVGRMESARRATLCAPQNPFAWAVLEEELGDQAEAIRNGRVAGKISEKEWKSLGGIYSHWQTVTQRMVTLDPDSSTGWKALACAATFNGDSETAANAFWKSYKLNPQDPQLLTWGLQMFQLKWGGDPRDFKKVISIAQQPSYLAYIGLDVRDILRALGDEAAAKAVETQTLQAFYAEMRAHRNSVQVSVRFALFQYRTRGLAISEYLNIAGRRRQSSLAYQLIAIEQLGPNPVDSIAAYKRAIELDPRHVTLERDLAFAYAKNLDYAEAISQLLSYLKTYPYDAAAYMDLGVAYYEMDKPDLALSAYEKVNEIYPTYDSVGYLSRFCDIQTRTGHLDSALKMGKRAIDAGAKVLTKSPDYLKNPYLYDVTWAHTFYAWALLKKGRLSESASECQIALKLDSMNAAAHQCLGEVLLAQGQTDKAVSEWKEAWKFADVENPGTRRADYYANLAQGRLEKYAPDYKLEARPPKRPRNDKRTVYF